MLYFLYNVNNHKMKLKKNSFFTINIENTIFFFFVTNKIWGIMFIKNYFNY